MINDSLKFITDEINKYLSLKLGATTDPRLIPGNVAKAFDSDSGGTNSLNNKAIISLVNVEEDRISKQQENYFRTDSGVKYKEPPVYLNLYVLFSINRTDYLESTKWLNYIIQFFQHKNIFTPISHPSLDPKIQKLVVDLYTLNFEQINHLWSTLGGKYIPSVLYKIRQVTVDEDLVTGGAGFITEIDTNLKTLFPVS